MRPLSITAMLVRQRQRLGLVVGDVDGGDADLALQALELAAHLVAQLGVEIGQRLVEQKQPRLVHDRARERHPLLLAAGKPRRGPLLEAVEIDDGERALHRFLDFGAANSAGAWRPSAGTPTFSATVMCGQMA